MRSFVRRIFHSPTSPIRTQPDPGRPRDTVPTMPCRQWKSRCRQRVGMAFPHSRKVAARDSPARLPDWYAAKRPQCRPHPNEGRVPQGPAFDFSGVALPLTPRVLPNEQARTAAVHACSPVQTPSRTHRNTPKRPDRKPPATRGSSPTHRAESTRPDDGRGLPRPGKAT